LSLLSAVASARGLLGGSSGCGASCDAGWAAPCAAACGCPSLDQIRLRVEIDEHPYKVETVVKTRKDAPVIRKTEEKDVPCTKMVPVQVLDCNGCPHTELQPQTVVEKVKSTTLDIPPLAPEECTTKTEEKVAQTIRIYIQHIPPGCAALPAPAK